MSLLTDMQNFLKTILHTESEDSVNFNSISPSYIDGVLSYGYLDDLTSLYVDDEDMPSNMNSCTHSVSYTSPYTRIRINEGNTNNTGSRYYCMFPFFNNSGTISISVDFYTVGMGNDDFGIRICDREELDINNVFNSYGAWIITGQGRLAYGYGGIQSNNVRYGDNLGSVGNNILYNYTMEITPTTAYYCIRRLDNGTIVSEKTYTRTDSYDWSGKFYLYIGGGKFSNGSADKSVYLKNLIIK